MKKTTFLLLLVSFVSARAWAKPLAGTNELRLGMPLLPGIAVTGINLYKSTDGQAGSSSSELTLLSLGAGYGRFLSNNVQIGGSLGFVSASGDGSSVSGPGISPFIRVFKVSGKLGFFAEASFQYASLSASSSTVSIYGGGIDAGLEFFLAESWALRVAPSFRLLSAKESSKDPADSSSSDEGLRVFGLNWGISAYF